MSDEARASRRTLLSSAATLAAGAAFALDGCGGSSLRRQVRKLPREVRRMDVAMLNRLLDIEYAAIAAYTAGIPLLSGRGLSVAKRFLMQELTHADELAGLISAEHGKAHHAKASYNLGHPRGGADVLRLLHMIESVQLAAYIEAIPRLSAGPVRAALASILANDAQHISVLRLTLGRPPAPAPLVTGRE